MHTLFPQVGGLTKAVVRQLAAERGLLPAERRSSAGICFIGGWEQLSMVLVLGNMQCKFLAFLCGFWCLAVGGCTTMRSGLKIMAHTLRCRPPQLCRLSLPIPPPGAWYLCEC